MPRTVRVFYINHKKDEKLLAELETHMSMLKHRGVIKEWKQIDLLAGATVAQETSDTLKNADLILPLVSAEFFGSKDCRAQMEQAVVRHEAGQACVIPILLRPFLWVEEEDLEGLVLLPRDPKLTHEPKAITEWSDRNKALMSVVSPLCKVIKHVQSGEEIHNIVGELEAIISEEVSAGKRPDPTLVTDERRTSQRELMPYLCDRGPQDKGLEDEIRKWFVGGAAADAPRKPLVGIVQGDEEECLSKYKRRLMTFSLQRFLRANPRNPFRVCYLKLPTAVSKVEDCLADFQSELSDKLTSDRFLLREQITDEIAKSGAPVFIHSWLDTETWGENTPEVVRTYLRFWHSLSPLPPTSQLICCLFLKHNRDGAESEAGREKARQFITDLDLSPYSGATILKLPELGPVLRGEALDWVRDGMNFQYLCNRHPMEFCDTERGEECIREEIYGSAKAVKQMKPLAVQLDMLIERYRCKR